jgi:hypothetical protein
MPQFIKNKQILISSDFDINNQKLINVSNPINEQDAATKTYVVSGDTSLSVALSTEISSRTSDVSSLSTAVSGSVTSLSSLTDVSLSNSIDYDLIYNSGGTWRNTPNLWTESNSAVTLRESDYDLSLDNIEMTTNGGVLTFADMSVTSSATIGTEESYSFNLDGSSIIRIYGQASGTTGITNSGLVLDGNYYYAGEPTTDGSWRWFVNIDGDLEFQKLIGGIWTYKQKFT